MFEPDLELREKVFGKMGWTRDDYYGIWIHSSSKKFFKKLPPIETTWEETVRLIKWMRKRGYDYIAHGYDNFSWGKVRTIISPPYKFMSIFKKVKIIDDNIAFAACKAFLEVEL